MQTIQSLGEKFENSVFVWPKFYVLLKRDFHKVKIGIGSRIQISWVTLDDDIFP